MASHYNRRELFRLRWLRGSLGRGESNLGKLRGVRSYFQCAEWFKHKNRERKIQWAFGGPSEPSSHTGRPEEERSEV